MSAAVKLVEAAWRVTEESEAWLEAIARAASAVTPGQGAMVYTFTDEPGVGVRIGGHAAQGVPDGFVEATLALNAATTDTEAARFYRSGILAGTVSERRAQTGAEGPDSYDRTVSPLGIPDTFGLTASGPDGRGVVINSPLSTPQGLTGTQRWRWTQLGAHLQAAWRLHETLQRPATEAILDAAGRLDHAEGEARQPDAARRLEDAVQRIEWVRHTEPDALDPWTALVDGRWSLIESYERDGRRHYLAVPNLLGGEALTDRALTERERQVVLHVVQGDSNKLVAYQLGIQPGTVATLLRRALDKLGVDSRRELIWLYHRLQGDR